MHRIRLYHPADRKSLYHICLATGNSGKDARKLYQNPAILGELYVGPYLVYSPEFCFTLENSETTNPVGYCIGVLDSKMYYKFFETTWRTRIAQQYSHQAIPNGENNPEDKNTSKDQQVLHQILHHTYTLADDLNPYPSHLHINLLPEIQGCGWGSKLMDTLLTTLKTGGSTGVHLGASTTNTSAIAFYKKYGFITVDTTEAAVIMAMSL